MNAVAKRHINMKIDSIQYIKPAIAYIQELMNLASEKGFIVSRINARELSNRLSDTINNDLIGPMLKVNRKNRGKKFYNFISSLKKRLKKKYN